MREDNVNPSSIDWMQRSDKRVSDQFLIEEVASSVEGRKHCRAMTFPAAEFLMEQELSNATPKTKWHIDAVEANPLVLSRMAITVGLLNAKRITTSVHPGRLLEVLQHYKSLVDWDEHQYDFIYTDWMGTWSLEKRDEMNNIFKRNLLKPGGCFAGTLSLVRGSGPAIDELDYFAEGEAVEIIDARPNDRKREYNYHIKTQGIPRYVMTQAARWGVKLQNPKVMVYDSLSDSGLRNTAQMKMVFQRSYV